MPRKQPPITIEASLSPVRISRDAHTVSRREISPGSLKVLYQLNEAGFDAYIVGGGVRDILLGLHPKDFDIATNATPEEVRELFRSSRIVGRRFRIVHVRMGREVVEVSTFRAAPEASLQVQVEGESLSRKVTHIDSARSTSGMLLRDNVYGDINGDALRRDFTVNALYYTVQNYEILDFVNGMQDLEHRVLRMIGDPVQRYMEDPVRSLRAIRLAVKLGFTIDPDTAAPLQDCGELLASIPAARLFDECTKLFFSGHALETWRNLDIHGLFAALFPDAAHIAEDDPTARHFFELALRNTDSRLAEGQSISPFFLLAVFLWPVVEAEWQKLVAAGEPEILAMGLASDRVIARQIQRVAIPRRLTLPMKEIWDMQLRLPRRTHKRVESMAGSRRFRAAYDFLVLREEAGYETNGVGAWWTAWQAADNRQQEQLMLEVDPVAPRSKRRRRKVKSRGRRPRQNSPQQ